MGSFKDLTGMVFGRLTVVRYAGHGNCNKTQWECKCSCGNTTIVKSNLLLLGKTKSCGCLALETKSIIHKKHGLRHTPLYSTWLNIKDRCFNPNNDHYKNYGARGIVMCDEWRYDFKKFYDWAIANGYKKHLSIERINVNDGYNPENCKWIPLAEQAKNKTNSIWIHDGETKLSPSEVAQNLGMAVSSIYLRIRHNKPILAPNSALRKVRQMDKNGNPIRTYASISEAAKTVGVDQSGIVRCCRGHYNSAGGYVWIYDS